MNTITIRLDQEIERMLKQIVRRSSRNRSDIVRGALRRQLVSCWNSSATKPPLSRKREDT